MPGVAAAARAIDLYRRRNAHLARVTEFAAVRAGKALFGFDSG
jgi:hypothetical protein